MTKLTANQESFIEMMTKSEEHAAHGFALLIARKGFENFFDALSKARLFSADKNPPIVPAEEPGYFRVPYWSALDYLEAVSRLAGESNSAELAQKVMNVVRNVSKSREPDKSIRDNHHTFRKFADILGLVPTGAITMDDIDLVSGWLYSKFERGMVARALDKGALRRLLASNDADDWAKACRILHHCTAISSKKEKGFESEREEPETVVQDYRLKELVENHAPTFGAKAPAKAAEVLLERTREVFRQDREHATWIWRPAIENHEQNYKSRSPENIFVEGLRDIVLSWTDHDFASATPFVVGLLNDEAEIVRRIGIHVLDKRWNIFNAVYCDLIKSTFFNANHLHEVHALLREHFAEFTQTQKEMTVEALRKLPKPTSGEEPDLRLKRTQRNWLSAIVNQGYGPADNWFAQLTADPELGGPTSHPDFHSYITVGWGIGPTPYETSELVSFAEEGSIVEKLNGFERGSAWRGPTTESLVQSLENAVQQKPQTFLTLLPAFIGAKRPYQYGLIKGFQTLWDASKDKPQDLDWNQIWKSLVTMFEQLLTTPEFWSEDVPEAQNLTPTRNWIPPLIADFLHAGTQADEHAYPQQLLPLTWKLMQILLEKSEAITEPQEDVMSQSINTSKGRAVEALFNHALRACRLSDKEKGEHAGVWNELKPVFEAELVKCKKGNYEFSTLSGCYISNLSYFDNDWLRAHIKEIFPSEFRTNCICATEGLAYAHATRTLYKLLVESGVLDTILALEHRGRYAREKLIERITLGYLWGDDELDSSRFVYLFGPGRAQDLEYACTFLWSVGEQDLSATQIERALNFWDRCVQWSRGASERPASLLSSLSRLSLYLKTIGKKELGWLLETAPYVGIHHNAEHFIEELERLVVVSPTEVSAVLNKVLDTYSPNYDFEDKLKSLLVKLAEQGKKAEAIALTERLRKHIPGMLQVYTSLTSG